MMHTLRLLTLSLISISLIGCGQKKSGNTSETSAHWPQLTLPADQPACRIQFPAEHKVEPMNQPGMKILAYFHETENLAVSLTVMKHSTDTRWNSSDREKLLHGMKNGAINMINGTLKREESVSLNGSENGLDCDVEASVGLQKVRMQMRFVVAYPYTYHIQWVQTDKLFDEASAKSFLNSFELLADDAKDTSPMEP